MKKKSNFISRLISIPEITAIIPFVVLVAVASILNPVFFKPANLSTMANSIIGSWGLLAIGQAFIIIVGEIDISVGGILAFAAISMSAMICAGVPLWLTIVIGFAMTIAIELINAFVVVKLKVPVFIATIGMQLICKGMAKVINYGAAISIYTADFPGVRQFCDTLAHGPLGISYSFWFFIIFVVIAQIVLKKTTLGKKIYAVGDNRSVAKTSGIKVGRIKTVCFLFMGILCGIAAVFWVGYYAGAMPTHGIGWEFISICAVALGGVSLIGGKGSIIGVLFGLLSMAVIYNVITLLRINENYQNILIGLFLAAAVILDVVRREKTVGKNV